MRNNNSRPFFSVVIPTLNEEICLPLLLNDLHKQSWTDFEVIHVDGGSHDKTVEEASKWQDKLNIRTITHDVKNVSAQRNRGASEAKGDWIIFMDADDLLPGYFLLGIKYRIENADAKPRKRFDVFSTLINLCDKDKRNSKKYAVANFINMFLRASSKTEKPMALGAMIGVRREVVDKIKFNEHSKVAEDNIFVKNCVSFGWKYLLLTNPRYIFSMRRISKNGVIKTATSGALMNLRYLMGDDMRDSDCGYEMLGGSNYNLDDEDLDEE
jgi:glycosyltransferase involved in cell wall biosynthesis